MQQKRKIKSAKNKIKRRVLGEYKPCMLPAVFDKKTQILKLN